ncbi:hypothetical protein [Hymenobacter cellulosilyticus]|uniref:Uncharacterized protein n=1 Tax=Hymenobacter cellulosilyticus TaxID=2932248 RepID=A0A8T9Q3Q6_9BACT|nr:hypothetical protein [Hymenobacter cellulosilyticus]UOQ70508.1 hypothetical protein MUN79_17475 [Hymenobacter cellulosilyticus]
MDFIDYYGVVQNTLGLTVVAAAVVSLVVFRAGMAKPEHRYVLRSQTFKILWITAAVGFTVLFVVGGSIDRYLQARFRAHAKRTAATTCQIRINGRQTKMPPAFFADLLRTVGRVDGRSTVLPGPMTTVIFQDGGRPDTFLFGQDSRDSSRYWILYPRYKISQRNEIDRIQTSYLEPVLTSLR